MFTKEEIIAYVDNGIAVIFGIGILSFVLAFLLLVIANANRENTYAEGYLQGQIDYRKGWINIKQDTLTNWKLK